MAKKDGICGQAGKTFLINPNLLFGQESSDNLFVPPEDLNIYVELTTSKKNRSILDVTDDGLVGTSTEKGKAVVSFIDGTKLDGSEKKSLTTSYTELTTVFNKTADTEKFGIKSIDINFNSAYAPLIKIEFIDIRGASLFNTGNPPNSEYSGFFDLPYPIFTLKVKGYYGKTVKYCLHLTRWNARFNAQTGNFEISADFIGYTYAMLTDMLLGYLRAITKTDRGYQKFKNIKEQMKNPDELITINELLNKIVDVNENIVRLQDKDEDLKTLSQNNELQTALDGVENLYNSGIESIAVPNDSSLKGYTLIDSGDGLVGVRNSKEAKEENEINKADLDNWKDAMKNQVTKLNDILATGNKIEEEQFTDVKYYEGFVYNEIMTGDTTTNDKQLTFRNEWGLSDDSKFEVFRERLVIRDKKDVNMNLYDFNKTRVKIDELKDSLKNDEEKIKKTVGQKLQSTFVETIGFEPSIRNIFRIFTVHAEVFMECLKEVSEEAEKDESKLRRAELVKLKDSFDMHSEDADDGGNLPAKIFPWPLYRKPNEDIKSKNNTLEEVYLGEDVEIPQNVPELVFVEELLEGLLAVGREDAERQERIDNPDVIVDSWFPINVLDTPLFGVTENPYKTATIGNSNNPLDPLKLMMMRAFAFLGASNRTLQKAEVQVMGALEANTCYEGVQNDIVSLAMIDGTKPDGDNVQDILTWFKEGKGKNRDITLDAIDGGGPRLFLFEQDNYYKYKFMSDNKDGGKGISFIPFTGNFDGEEFYNSDGSAKTHEETRAESWYYGGNGGNVFLAPSPMYDDNFQDTGALHMRIFTEDEYNDDAKALRPQYINQVDKIQKMVNIVKAETEATPFLDSGTLYSVKRELDSSAGSNVEIKGWNILGDETAKFAFTTVKLIDISNAENQGDSDEQKFPIPTSEIPAAPLKSVFYISHNPKFGATCLSKKRVGTAPLALDVRKGTVGSTVNEEYYHVNEAWSGARPFSDDLNNSSLNQSNPQLGQNRELFNEDDVYIPYCDFAVTQRDSAFGTGDNRYQVFSLFGSRLYFEQRRSSSPKSAKALLFLHTLPWNQLYTDNGPTSNYECAIFDNDEGDTISNLFNRKSAFLNVPYLWCAFIGGLLWRFNTADINYKEDNGPGKKDPSGLIPSYAGGSGSFDPIVWGRPVTPTSSTGNFERAFISDFNIAYRDQTSIPRYAFPQRWQYLTSVYADAPFQLDTDSDSDKDFYKNLSITLQKLPVQIKKEFRRIFFDFVGSAEWNQIRKTYEVAPVSWNDPDGLPSSYTWNENGYNNANWAVGANLWTETWDEISEINSPNKPSSSDNLLISMPTSKPVTKAYTGGKTAGSTYTTNETTPSKVIGIKKSIADTFPNVREKNFEYFQPIRQRPHNNGKTDNDIGKIILRYDYDVAFADNDANKTLVELFKRGVWIANASYKNWVQYSHPDYDVYANSQQAIGKQFAVKKVDLEDYLTQFVNEWKRLNELDTKTNEENALKQQLFNTMDSDVIRLNIYRHCKSLYDKWIAGSGGNIMTSCGSDKKSKDIAIASEERTNRTPRLIDSFRFVNRAFNDIGDDYLINPQAINDIVVGNMNQSFYDLISRILGDNNFNFIALPSYIDFNSVSEIASIFKPQIFNQELDDDVAGPTFVCVYVGQSSKHLDLGRGSSFPNDGFDFKCDENGNLTGLPLDFTKESDTTEHNVVAFAVNYGQQNQNIFQDVKLDQKEFAETDESLQITDSIANNGSQSDRTQAGQNLWNVYQVRSYSTEVSMLGNAMIQPMMYFQLNNIPMFHGAYMIIHTKHKITANHMKTTFKGVRTRFVDTPLIDSETLYMSMLGTLSDVDGAGDYVIDDPDYGKGYNSTNGLASDVLPTDPDQVNALGFASVYPSGINTHLNSGMGKRSAQAGASKNHPGIDIAPKDGTKGTFLAPNEDTSIVWSKGFDYSSVDKDHKNRPKVNVPVLAGADAEIFGLRVSPSVGIILDVLVNKTYDGKGYVMRYMHILDVSDKIVKAAGKKAGFTLDDWKNNNIPSSVTASNLGIKVKKGEILGLTGGQRKLRKFGTTDTAGPYSSGPHLHLELLEFDGDNFNTEKIKTCVSCRKSDYASRGLTATLKDYQQFLADGGTGTSYSSNQGDLDDQTT
jgi:murein DD-endopeptidase MepM/ murein hydrolase activator NlpD